MKKTLIAIAALAAAMVGCKQYGDDVISVMDGIGEETFYGYIDEEARTLIDSENKLNWESDDHISIFHKSDHNLKYPVVLADGAEYGRNATFPKSESYVEGTGAKLDKNYAILPFHEENTVINGSTLVFPLSAVLENVTVGNADNIPLVGVSDTHEFYFKNPTALLRINVSKEDNPNEYILKQITLTSRLNNKIAGTAHVDMTADRFVATIADDANASNKLTINLGEGVVLKKDRQYLYVAMPEVTLGVDDLEIGYTATVQGDEVKGVIKKSASIPYEAGKMRSTSIVVVDDPYSGSTEDDPVANVNGVEYTTLEAAFKAAIDLGGEQTISVVADASVKEAITVPASSKINLILNGNNVTSELTGITITNNGTLNVMGGTITAAGETIRVMNGGSLTVGTGATVASKTDTAVFVPNGATANVVVYGTLHSDAERYAALQTNGMSSAVITIEEGAKIIGTKTGAMYCPGATITINGGEITGSTAIYHKKGSLVINGGTFTATGTHVDYGFNGSGANATSDALVVEACDVASGYTPCSVEIYGGTFVATDTANGARALAFYEQPGVTVDPVESTIIAGTYNTDPNEYVTRGYKATQNAEGLWVVGENFEATIGSTKYVTVAEAFAAAQKGNTITLLKDATLTESIVVTDNNVLSDITLDGAGKTVTLNMTSGTGFQFGKSSVSAWATGVKIKDLTIKGTATYALYLCGGTSSVIDNLTVEGTYDNGGYGAVILYGTHGATISNSNICSGFSNGSDVYPLNLVNTQWGELFINASEIDATAKLFIDDQSYVDKVICGSYKSNMVDYDSIERIGTLKAEIEKKGSTTYGEYDMVAELNKVLYANVEDAIAEANDGDTIVLLEGDHQIGGINRKDSSVNSLTLEGLGVDKTTIRGVESQNDLPDIYASGLNVTFKNLTFDSVGEYESGIGGAASVTFEKCTILKEFYCQSGAKHTFTECTFEPGNGYIYTWGSHCVFDTCVFNSAYGKALQVCGVTNQVFDIEINNCTFNAAQTGYTYPGTLEGGGKPVTAVDINSTGNGGFNVVINNATLTGPWGVGIYSHSTLFNDKSNNPEKVTVTVDGRTYVTNGVWINQAGEYEIENANGLAWFGTQVNVKNNSFSGKTVKVVEDIDMTGVVYPAGSVKSHPSYAFAGTFDGGDKTISNLTIVAENDLHGSAALIAVAKGYNTTIKNVKLNNVNIESSHNAAGILGYVTTGNWINITNCHVDGGTITGHIYNNDNGDKIGGIAGLFYDGTVSGCSVKNVTINGYRDVGGLVGYANDANAKVINNAIENVTINVNNSNNYKKYKVQADYDVESYVGEGDKATITGNTGEATINWGAISESNPGVTINPGQGDDIDW